MRKMAAVRIDRAVGLLMKGSSSLAQPNRIVTPYTSYGLGLDSDVPPGSRAMRTIARSLVSFLFVAMVAGASWLMNVDLPRRWSRISVRHIREAAGMKSAW